MGVTGVQVTLKAIRQKGVTWGKNLERRDEGTTLWALWDSPEFRGWMKRWEQRRPRRNVTERSERRAVPCKLRNATMPVEGAVGIKHISVPLFKSFSSIIS